MQDIWVGASASFVCTALGAVPALFLKNVSHRGKDILLAYTAGIMVAASTYGLIPSALELSNVWVLAAGVLAGTFILTLIEMFLPHVDPDNTMENSNRLDSGLFLFMAAMIIHNIPEGLSVGLSYASDQGELGHLVAFAIGLQNVPEGFLVAIFLQTQGVARLRSFAFSALTGLFEMLAYFLGYRFSDNWEPIIPFGLAFAAGAMLFVVYKELIPDSHGDGHERTSTFSFIIGLLTMIIMSEAFK